MKLTVTGGSSDSATLAAVVGELAEELYGDGWSWGEGTGRTITFAERRSQWPKMSFRPSKPDAEPSSLESHFSSVRSWSFVAFLPGVSSGRFSVQRWVTVQTFGVGRSWTDSILAVLSVCRMAEMERTACHSAIRLATPRQISGRRRSSGWHTLPGINLYRRPLLKRANRGGASL